MQSTTQSIHRRTMKGKKQQYDFLHFEYKVTFSVITSEYSGRKYSPAEVKRPLLKLANLEAENYRSLITSDGSYSVPSAHDAARIKEQFSQFFSLHREINCSISNNKPKRNVLLKLRQMFNEDLFDSSVVYYSGAANKQGNWVVESHEFGDEEISFKEILDLWTNRTSKQKYLLIILDSSYSGKWIKDLAAKPIGSASIGIAAACKDIEKAYESEIGGYYTHNLLKFLTKNSSENVITSNQCPQFGGDYLFCKKFTNLYMKFNSWQELAEWQKVEYVMIDYENGTYLGYFLNGQKHNWGVFLWKNGVFKDCKYMGEFRGGRLHGRGLLMYNNGRTYEGDFENNTPHGYAIESYPNGDRYEGQFQHGYKCGKGIYHYSNGEIYDGKFFDNKPHGPGILKMPNGAVYEGNFAGGKCNGKGKFTYGNGDVYDGEWVNSVKHGKGTYFYSNGNVYVGEFQNGMRHGYGKHASPSGEVYEGMWENDLKSGDGAFHSNGNTFNGEWSKGKITQTTKFFSKTGTQKLTF